MTLPLGESLDLCLMAWGEGSGVKNEEGLCQNEPGWTLLPRVFQREPMSSTES